GVVRRRGPYKMLEELEVADRSLQRRDEARCRRIADRAGDREMRTAQREVGVADAKCARIVFEPSGLSEPHGFAVDVEVQPIEIGGEAKVRRPVAWSGHVETDRPRA